VAQRRRPLPTVARVRRAGGGKRAVYTRLVRALVCVLALTAFAPAAARAAAEKDQRLSPAEQKWVEPLIALANTMAADLRQLPAEIAAKDALVVGTGTNLTLTTTLASFLTCSPTVKKAGPPPSARLKQFRTKLTKACFHLSNAAHDLAKAIGAIRERESGAVYLNAFAPELKKGSALLSQAEKQLLAVGGRRAGS